MQTNVKKMNAVATRLESLARLIREKPEDVKKALSAIRGNDPDAPDPYFLTQEDRYAFVDQIADKLGISAGDLLLIYEVMSPGQNTRR